jgi:hypothetical protein
MNDEFKTATNVSCALARAPLARSRGGKDGPPESGRKGALYPLKQAHFPDGSREKLLKKCKIMTGKYTAIWRNILVLKELRVFDARKKYDYWRRGRHTPETRNAPRSNPFDSLRDGPYIRPAPDRNHA